MQNYDTKPKRRLFELLKSQGLQANQQVTFLSDGADDVREVPLYLSPESEHWLNWFHITMRLAVLGQLANGLESDQSTATPPDDAPEDLEESAPIDAPEAAAQFERVKWFLWHGNVARAPEILDDLDDDLNLLPAPGDRGRKLLKAMREFQGYVTLNRAYIPNYDDRYRHGEAISTAFAESTINQVVSKRMVKRQQMRWSQRGAHHLLQVRTKVLKDELRQGTSAGPSSPERADQERSKEISGATGAYGVSASRRTPAWASLRLACRRCRIRQPSNRRRSPSRTPRRSRGFKGTSSRWKRVTVPPTP